MNNLIISSLLLSCMLTNCGPNSSETSRTTKTFETSEYSAAATTYASYCAGCHGAQLEGGSASELIKTEWTYGRGKGQLIRNIKHGIPSSEMIAWGSVLNDEQIGTLADFIIEAQEIAPEVVREIPSEIKTEHYLLTVEKFVESGLEVPWAIEFIDENRALISERKGNLRWLVDGKPDPNPIQGVPKTHTGSSTGGYMDIALDPAYPENGWVYLSFSHTDEGLEDKEARSLTKIVRGRIKDHQWIDEQTLFQVPDSLRVVKGNRWGCRFLFDKKGFLYFTIGDMAQAMDSQNSGKATGKVFRIHPDGSIPKDNPFVNKPGALPAVFTLGNRNTQGLAQHPITGEIWSTDHGPMGGDELNILKKGANYGWPVITYGKDYSGEIVSNLTQKEGMEQPIYQWTPSIGICPAEFSTSPLFPEWENNLFVGALAYEELRRLVIEDQKIGIQEMILKGFGRVRDLKIGPDGALYVVLNNPDMIIRLSPAEGGST